MKDYMNKSKEWVACDFDGTLAEYTHWKGPTDLGRPIGPMVVRVARWLYEGRKIKIFTARCWPYLEVPANRDPRSTQWITSADIDSARMTDAFQAITAIQDWCLVNFGQQLDITCVKDLHMIELWDDRAVQVEANTGVPLSNGTRGLA